MSRTWIVLGAVVLPALMVMPAWAETARVQGMGYTMLAVGTDAGAWYNNSALVSRIDLLGAPHDDWGTRASITDEVAADFDATSVDVTLRRADGRRGFGAGYMRFTDEDVFGASYGQACNWIANLYWGLMILNFNDDHPAPHEDDNTTLFNLGFAYEAPYDSQPVHLRYAAEIWDLTSQEDTEFNIGAACYWNQGFVLAADIIDLFDEAFLDIGGEYNWDMFSARLGSADGDFTAGLGYHRDRFDFGISYRSMDVGDDSVAVMFGGGF